MTESSQTVKFQLNVCRRVGVTNFVSSVRIYSAAAPQNQLKRPASSLRPYTHPTQKIPFWGSRNTVFRSAVVKGL